MLFGTVFLVVVIPGLYYIFARMAEKHQFIKDELKNAGRILNPASVTLLFSTLLFVVALSGCKVPQVATPRAMPPVPETFSNNANTDTLNVATLNWRMYFADSTLNGLIAEALTNNLNLLTA